MTSNKKQELRELDLDTELVQQQPEIEQSYTPSFPQPLPYPYGYPVPQPYAWVPAYDPRNLGGMFGLPGFPGGGFPGGGFPGGGVPGGGMTPGFPQPGFPQQPGFPGPGFPGPGGPGGPSFPGGPQGGGQQAPTSAPPAYTPQKPVKPAGYYAVDPGAIAGCLFRFTYVWLSNGQQFWYYPIFVGSNSIAGFRWTGFSWMYFGIDLRFIDSFTC